MNMKPVLRPTGPAPGFSVLHPNEPQDPYAFAAAMAASNAAQARAALANEPTCDDDPEELQADDGTGAVAVPVDLDEPDEPEGAPDAPPWVDTYAFMEKGNGRG